MVPRQIVGYVDPKVLGLGGNSQFLPMDVIWGDALFPFGSNMDNLALVCVKVHQPI